MYQLILLIHVFAAVFIIALVLVQQGKGATMGAAFGSGASQTVFGSRGSGSFLFRITITLVTVFFLTSISLNYIAAHAIRQEKVISLPMVPAKQQAPAKSEQSQGIIIPERTSPAATKKHSDSEPALPNEIPSRKTKE